MTSEEKRRRLQEALDRAGTHTMDDLLERLRDGRAQFWAHDDGCVVTEILDYPRAKVANYWLLSGVLGDCLALNGEIEAWARGQGCTVASAMGRRGWIKAVEPLGWQPHGVLFHKQLNMEGQVNGRRPV